MNFDYEKDILYAATIGNGKFNVSLADTRFSRFLHPIDVAHDARLRFGVYGEDGELQWLEEAPLSMNGGICTFGPLEFFVDSVEPILALRLQTKSKVAVHWIMRLLCSTTENSVQFNNGSLMFFKRNYWFGMTGRFSQHSCGHFLSEQLEGGKLSGADFAMRDCEAAGILEPDPEIFIAAGRSMNSVSDALKRAHYLGFEEMKGRTSAAWGAAGGFNTSAYVLSMLQGETGAIIAAPEFDPEYRYSGGYGYCWPRDASYCARAFDILGAEERAAKLLRWLAEVSHKGDFNQRYCLDGTFGPAWSNQVDQIGSFLWALERHSAQYPNTNLLKKLFPTVEDCVGRLIDFLYSPGVSVDLWEERSGVHAYSCASIYGGLICAHRIATFLGYYKDSWPDIAEELKKEFVKIFYDSENGIFVRAVLEDEPDRTPDSSILGVAAPFSIVEPNDSRMASTIRYMEKGLMRPSGLARYSGDAYPQEGGVWPLCTAWLSWYSSLSGNTKKAEALLDLVRKCSNRFGFLPEQAGEDFAPRWAIPLAWSHSMYLIAQNALSEAQLKKG